jgi:inhibitor of KinA sporulation pathway (predicted exonuclease)
LIPALYLTKFCQSLVHIKQKENKAKMENKIKIFFDDDEESFEKSFEKHSQEMRARMDSAFGSSSGSGSKKA